LKKKKENGGKKEEKSKNGVRDIEILLLLVKIFHLASRKDTHTERERDWGGRRRRRRRLARSFSSFS